MRKINKIIIHCTDADVSDMALVRAWHLIRGWDDAGYHALVRKDGGVEWGRPVGTAGAHAYGHNKDSLGLVFEGKGEPTYAQRQSGKAVIARWRKQFGNVPVYPHNHFNKGKTCPNFDISILE